MTEPTWLPLRALRALVEATSDAIVVTSAEALNWPGPKIVYANPAFCQLAGYELNEIIGMTPRVLQGPGTDRAVLRRMKAALVAGRGCHEEILNYAKDGRPYWLDIKIVPLFGEDGTLQYFAAIERDITKHRNMLDRLDRMAHKDILTGLANRAALEHFLSSLAEGIGDGPAGPRPAAERSFLMIDLDGFKAVNDTLGHGAGDEILRAFAAFVINLLPGRDDFVARLGGDEFVVVLSDYSPSEARHLAEQIAGNLALMECVGAPLIGASIGMTRFIPGESLDDISARADQALYAAKAAGKGVVREHAQGDWREASRSTLR